MLGIVIGLAVPTGVWAQAVLQSVTVLVEPGKLDAYMAGMKRLEALHKRVSPSSSPRVWQSTMGGETSGTGAVGIIYPSLSAYAEDIRKIQGDPEWDTIIGGFEGIRTVVSQSLFVAP